MPNGEVRVRFAPSPTGMLHVGGARTAIYNWAYARATGGSFVLRIEDTDPERSTEENTQIILRALRWLGLDWDEGPEVGGEYGPYFQMQRMDTYMLALETLKERDAVYPCFCSKEELDTKREAAGEAYSGYDRTCRHLSKEEAQARIDAGEAHVWRLKVPEDHGPVEFNDEVYGPMSFPIEVMDDMILVRSDGSPTYNFAVVCDDVNMAITHVIRGDDHLSNTPRQILIYEALGAAIPRFAHLSMILGSDGKKLSKRHGATSVEEYKEAGYLSDCMVNFLALLGWSLDGESTIIDRETLCREFSLERVTKKDAVFDDQKLDWMNGQYIQALGPKAWVDLSTPWLARAHAQGYPHVESVVVNTSNDQDADGLQNYTMSDEQQAAFNEDSNTRPSFYEALYPLVSERETTLSEAQSKLAYMFWGPSVVLDETSVNKVLRKDGARADEALRACRGVLADESIAWLCDPLQDACKALCEPLDIKPKNLFQPLRVAVCGDMVSPPLFESIELMKREDVLARIDFTLSEVFGV
ncbi:MAG: glutamate--tRNA ligase [Eggerthellaceae bacterium]|nr:glutamate--tRNA ligase [Eggerthellaceae bacterium]